MIYISHTERIPCGEPEVPVEGEVERVNDRTARFKCRPGYTLEGDDQLTCSSKGTWEGQAPRCKGEYSIGSKMLLNS